MTDSPLDDRVEAVELVDPADLEKLDMRPPIAADLLEYLRSPDTPCAKYLGPLFTEDRP